MLSSNQSKTPVVIKLLFKLLVISSINSISANPVERASLRLY